MKKIKLPKKVKVGGCTYSVEFPYIFESHYEHLGMVCNTAGVIRITDKYESEVRSNDCILETLIHELMHCIDFISMGEILSEESIGVNTRAWLQVIKDNNLYLDKDKIPKRIKVGCFNYEILFPYKFKEATNNIYLKVLHNNPKIMLNDNDGTENFSIDFIKVCLIFSIQQAICAVYFSGLNEEDCKDSSIYLKNSYFSHALYQVFKDNKIIELVNKYKDR